MTTFVISDLNRVEFDCPFQVLDNGTIVNNDTLAPSVYDGEIESDSWEFASTGYTGQHGYNGPTMHPSELLSGRLARDILATPGVYVVTADEVSECDACSDTSGDYADCGGDHFPAGWVVLRKV